jgi:hypothetical protein
VVVEISCCESCRFWLKKGGGGRYHDPKRARREPWIRPTEVVRAVRESADNPESSGLGKTVRSPWPEKISLKGKPPSSSYLTPSYLPPLVLSTPQNSQTSTSCHSIEIIQSTVPSNGISESRNLQERKRGGDYSFLLQNWICRPRRAKR